jgi:hypothetical protein
LWCPRFSPCDHGSPDPWPEGSSAVDPEPLEPPGWSIGGVGGVVGGGVVAGGLDDPELGGCAGSGVEGGVEVEGGSVGDVAAPDD